MLVTAGNGQTLISATPNQWLGLQQSVRDADWQACARRSIEAIGRGRVELRTMRVDAARHAAIAETFGDHELLATLVLAHDSEHAEVVASINESLTLLTDTLDSNPDGRAPLQWAVALASRGLQGSVHASFNLVASSDHATGPFADQYFRTRVAEFQDDVETARLALYGSCVAGDEPDEVALGCVAMADLIEARAPEFAEVLARGHRELRERLGRSQGGSAERLANVVIAGHTALRIAIAEHAAVLALSVELASGAPGSDARSLHTEAARRPFAAPLPNATNHQLADLEPTLDGHGVEIIGVVVESRAVRTSDGKLVSRVQLLDPSSGAEATLCAVFADLGHAGVAAGSFLRAHGIFRVGSVLNDGEPAVEATRLSLAELAETSWSVALIRSARAWFSPWRNGNHVEWALAPHTAIGGDRAVRGANEMLYTRLIRRR